MSECDPTQPAPSDLAAILAEHHNKGSDVRWDRDELDWIHWWRCMCGYEVTYANGGAYWYEDHVAQVIADTYLPAVVREAEVRGWDEGYEAGYRLQQGRPVDRPRRGGL